MAPVWRSPVHLLQGPPETISVRARETAWDQIDEFIAEFLRQNPQYSLLPCTTLLRLVTST